MHNNFIDKTHCSKCGKIGGILICNGCQLTFCNKHVIKHREELENRLDDIIEEHDLIRDDIQQSTNEYFYLRKINQWEKDSIKQIRSTADIARRNLKQIFDKSKKRLTKISEKINYDLKSSWKADDFSENDLKKWLKQLNELQLEIKTSYSIHLIEDQRYPIYPIIITTKNSQTPTSNMNNKIRFQEYFSKATSYASIENDGLIVKHIGPDTHYAHILGKQSYSQGRHTIQFKIIQMTLPYIIFFGCISTEMIQKSINYNSSHAVGWFGYNEIYEHGIWNNNFNVHGYDSNEFELDDMVHLILDCDRRHIELFHERINKTYRLPVNIEKAPLPWKFLVVLVHDGDSVKIISKIEK